MILWYHKFLICFLNSRFVLWASIVLCSYVLVCSVAYYPGDIVVGPFSRGALEAHLTGLGHTIRMVMHHLIGLKRCAVAKEIAFRKVCL